MDGRTDGPSFVQEVFTPTQYETRHVAGDPGHSCEEKENNEEGPGWAEDLDQAGEALQCHGSKQDGFPSKPANSRVKGQLWLAAHPQVREADSPAS